MGNIGSVYGGESANLQKRAIFIYVSPSGSDSNSGTSTSAPLKTIQAAVNKAVAGDTIFLRAGTYAPSTNIQITKSGTSSAPITLKNYNGEKVIIDGENMPYTPAALGADLPNADRGAIHIQNANYWIFEGLEVIHGAYGVYSRDASYNIYRNLITRDNYESGLQIQGTAAYNQVINLDSYGNRDPRKNGESADGLAIKEGSGAGNVVRGARLWNNADDGFDAFEFISPILIENSVAWGNGFNRWGFSDFVGDGRGFKMGGGGTDYPGAHTINNSMAFSNAAVGFDDNKNPAKITFLDCTAWNHTGAGFKVTASPSVLKSNLAITNNPNSNLGSSVSQSGNSWNIGGTWTLPNTNPSVITGARLSNGLIPSTNFLVPSGSTVGATFV
ncbi:hypothetical protein FS842_007200 [Serendipita sp. 407]|nr:hypothetical protein FS842_007200 [Serendipita sp. 407]